MSEVVFSLRDGSAADLPAMADLDNSFSSEWVLYLERSGGNIEQTMALRWKRVKPEGSRRIFAPDVERLARHLHRSERLIVAEANGRSAGYVMLAVNSWNETAEIVEVVVDLQFRGRGLGKRFVAEAEQFARERGLRSLQWESQNDNRHAIEFACGQRFRIAGFHDSFYENRGYERQGAADFIGLAVFMTREFI